MTLTQPFPTPGSALLHAYRDLDTAAHADAHTRATLGPTQRLQRPWDPPTCHPPTRIQLWAWLDAVAAWINHEYAWTTERLIPPCWPHHPHLVHELAVIADQRHRAGNELTSDALEIWHRDTLPLFLDRTRARLAEGCATSHNPCPAAGRHRAYQDTATNRLRAYADDTTSNQPHPAATPNHRPAALALIDLETGQLLGHDTLEPRP